MRIEFVKYHKRCLQCGYSTGIVHEILWKGTEEFRNEDGSLIDEAYAIKLISDWHCDVNMKCDGCGTTNLFKFWDIAIGHEAYEQKKKPEFYLSLTGGKQTNVDTRIWPLRG